MVLKALITSRSLKHVRCAAGGFHLWVVSNLEEPRPQKLALEGLAERPHCMAVIEPRHTLSGCVEVSRRPLPHVVQALQSWPC